MSAALAVERMTVKFGGVLAIDDVSFATAPGLIQGVIGPNGAGKTTLFNAITGLVAPASGTIRLDGRDITREPAHIRARGGMRRSFQSVQLIQQLTVLENVLLGLDTVIAARERGQFFAFRHRGAAERDAQDTAQAALSRFGIGHLMFALPAQLSFAEQRWVEIVRATIAGPGVLLLDEPAAGLSPPEVLSLNRLLRQLRSELGLTILLVEHVLSLLLDVSDRVLVLDNGRAIANGSPAQVQDDPAVRRAYLGRANA